MSILCLLSQAPDGSIAWLLSPAGTSDSNAVWGGRWKVQSWCDPLRSPRAQLYFIHAYKKPKPRQHKSWPAFSYWIQFSKRWSCFTYCRKGFYCQLTSCLPQFIPTSSMGNKVHRILANSHRDRTILYLLHSLKRKKSNGEKWSPARC